jgi:hypothetical protein
MKMIEQDGKLVNLHDKMTVSRVFDLIDEVLIPIC